jgi:hypothetical protein
VTNVDVIHTIKCWRGEELMKTKALIVGIFIGVFIAI